MTHKIDEHECKLSKLNYLKWFWQVRIKIC
jgi:hypothetical protein